LDVRVYIDGRLELDEDLSGQLGTRTPTSLGLGLPYFMESGSPTTHTMEVWVGQDCHGDGENLTLNGFGIDVTGMH